MAFEDPRPDLYALRTELRILQEEHGKAMALGAYLSMSVEQNRKFDERRTRINQLLLILATQS